MPDDLHSLSLGDLRLLSMLLERRSITRVAEGTGQPQPAVSRKLQRFRELFADPLIVRSGGRMVATERGLAIALPVREILAQAAALGRGSSFDPVSTQRTFNIVCADCLPPTFLPAVIARVTGAGPRLALHIRPSDPAFDVTRALDEGDVDLVISNDSKPREDLRTTMLLTDEVVCMMRRDHPLARDRRIPLARYLQMRHLVPAAGSLLRSNPIDGELMKTGYHRNIVATVPEFNLVPYALLDSDLVFTTARRFAEHYGATMPLLVVRAPAEIPPMRFYQLWHERNQTSAANRWLRAQVEAVAASLAG
ncbi:LysR substrate-binding domain-containing protein [soil metagenome]